MCLLLCSGTECPIEIMLGLLRMKSRPSWDCLAHCRHLGSNLWPQVCSADKSSCLGTFEAICFGTCYVVVRTSEVVHIVTVLL